MTVSTRINRVSYRADGVATAFDFRFFIPAGALRVYLTRDGAAEEVSLSRYRASGLGRAEGGRVIFHEAPREGVVTLVRRVPLTQDVALLNGAAFHAEVLEEALDKAAMGLQQLEEGLERALAFPIGDAPDAAARTLPRPMPGRALKWNADGTGLVNSAADPDAAYDLEAAIAEAEALRRRGEAAILAAEAAAAKSRVQAETAQKHAEAAEGILDAAHAAVALRYDPGSDSLRLSRIDEGAVRPADFDVFALLPRRAVVTMDPDTRLHLRLNL